MNEDQPNKRRRLANAVRPGAVGAGVLFVIWSEKSAESGGILNLVRQYDMVSSPFLLNSIAAALPWFEVFADCCCWLGLPCAEHRGAGRHAVPFTLLILKRALAVAGLKTAFCM